MRYDEALGALVEFAASRHNAFHSSEAATINITAERLRRAELEGVTRRLHPRVWALANLPSSAAQQLRAAVLSVDGSAATATSAAWLHGWLESAPPSPQLWVPKTRHGDHPHASLHRWARIDPGDDVTTINHVRTLTKAAALCSLGPFVDDLTLERCLDEFLRCESSRWLDETMVRLASHKPGGVRALERVRSHPRRAPGLAESWFERLVAKLLDAPGLPSITLQHDVEAGGRRYRLDIACPELMLGIEAHSRRFHWGADKANADNVRDLALSAAGWQILYVTWAQLQRPDEFIRQFATTAKQRARQLDIALPAA